MTHRLVSYRALVGMLVISWLALPLLPATAAGRSVSTGTVAGTVTAVSGNSFTIQTPGPRIGTVNALTAAATRITKRDYPYVYGGGHAEAGIASIGIKGPGYNGRRVGFDCSGSVAAVLSAAGLWPAGGGVPNDAGIIATLRSEGLIARGVGRGPVEVTLYDRPGVHIFMNIDGRFFGTSDGYGGGDPRGGAGWLDDGAPDASRSVYHPYHFRRWVLKRSASSGHTVSLQVGALQSLVATLAIGDKVQVSYREASWGGLVATSLSFPGASTVSGTVTTLAPDGSAFTVQTVAGASLTFSTASDWSLVQELGVGDTVTVTYTNDAGTLTARAVSVTGSSGSGGDGGNDSSS